MKALVLPVVVLVAVLLSPAGCELYYVRGSSSSPDATPCPPEASPCLTLQEYVNNSTEFLPENMSDAEFRFLSGEHLLSKPFVVEGGRNISLRSANVRSVWDGLDVTVKCQPSSYLQFRRSASLSIHGIAFHGCGDFGLSLGAIKLDSIVDLNVQDIELVDSTFADIFASESYGWYNVSDMVSKSTHENSVWSHIHIEILTDFHINFSNIQLFANAAQGIVVFSNKSHNDSSVTVRNVEILGDIGRCGINLTLSAPILIENCIFRASGSVAFCVNSSSSISIVNSMFTGSQTGLQANIKPSVVDSGNNAETTTGASDQNAEQTFLLSKCFFSNDGGLGAVLITGPVSSESTVTLSGLIFADTNSTTEFNIISGIVILVDLPNVTIEGLQFSRNDGTPLLLINTVIHVYGENYFIGNQAARSGGMAFIESSALVLHNNSLLVFRNNRANNVGGAWYVSSEDVSLYPLGIDPICFITVHPPPTSQAELNALNISVQFINNSATNGGNVLYGGNIDLCTFTSASRMIHEHASNLLSEETIFSYEPEPEVDRSRLASPPTRVCLCDDNGVPNCTKFLDDFERRVYPGQSFTVSVVAVGQQFGVVNGTVYGQLLTLANQSSSVLENLLITQRVGQPECTTLSYSVHSRNPMETLVLTTSVVIVKEINYDLDVYIINNYLNSGQITDQLLSLPVFVNVSVQECPPGFVLSEELLQCVCDPTLERNRLTCDIDIGNGIVVRSGEVWVSYWTSNQSTGQDGVVVSQSCPNGYCNQSTQHINLRTPDAQCNYDRSGVLCGGCAPGLSLALGSNRCLNCSNSFIALLIPFAVSGVLLVMFMQVLDLTVAVGTINGLIFYANAVKSYQLLFFVPGQTNILTVFISWLNLDFGIETCFFDGLDGYVKTWLQFAFPLYLWLLAGLIVVMSRYTRFEKIFAGNAVHVLATMFLLSFNKLLQIALTANAFSFVSLELPDGSKLITWAFDPNILYLSVKHMLLFVASVLIFTLTGLPYLLVLLFYQCLLRVNHKRGCRWVFKLKPFFDANFGPLKDKHLYWVGVLLLARAVLLLVMGLTPSSNGALISVALVSSFLILYSESFVGHVYKNWLLSLLENSFFVNLIILSVATCYVKTTEYSQAPVIYTSISIALLEFIGIVCYHSYKRMRMPTMVKKFKEIKKKFKSEKDNGPRIILQPVVTYTVVDLHHIEGRIALRESLLEC